MASKRAVDIIVHCHAERHEVFARLLTAQLSSLVLEPPECRVSIFVCTTPTDKMTRDVVRNFGLELPDLIERLYPATHIFRRAIARNAIAKESRADVVWHADCDYWMSAGFLDRVVATEFPADRLLFPQEVMIHKSHAEGDKEIARIVPGEVFRPNFSLFQPHGNGVAIGGLQFVRGDVARRGYLDSTKWCEPVSEAGGFRDTKEDKQYRAAIGGSTPMDWPGLWRFRHSVSAFESAERRLAQTAGKT